MRRRRVSVKLGERELGELDRAAEYLGISRSELVRLASADAVRKVHKIAESQGVLDFGERDKNGTRSDTDRTGREN